MGELRLFYWAFKHAPLLRVPLCVSWAFLVDATTAASSAYVHIRAYTYKDIYVRIRLCVAYLHTLCLFA